MQGTFRMAWTVAFSIPPLRAKVGMLQQSSRSIEQVFINKVSEWNIGNSGGNSISEAEADHCRCRRAVNAKLTIRIVHNVSRLFQAGE
jgi:hypothetical protein